MIYQVLKRLTTPFDETKAFELGLIDKDGKLLKKAKSGEYHQCETRIENLTKKLQGDRAERMKKSQKENASFLSIVQLFQEEEERKTMARIAEMQKQAIKKEAERLEGMAEWKARVLGISQEDVI